MDRKDRSDGEALSRALPGMRDRWCVRTSIVPVNRDNVWPRVVAGVARGRRDKYVSSVKGDRIRCRGPFGAIARAPMGTGTAPPCQDFRAFSRPTRGAKFSARPATVSHRPRRDALLRRSVRSRLSRVEIVKGPSVSR